MNKKVLLMILDGWGIAPDPSVSAVDAANTPFIDSLYPKYPHSKLQASGLDVGLPAGQMGNSEVGHMNLGAGRVVNQTLVKINKAVDEKLMDHNPVLLNALHYAKENNRKVHFIGLVSDGGVHSHIDHLKALCRIAQKEGVKDVFVHAFTDGRDTGPQTGLGFISELEESLKTTGGKIASVIGRYYAMDRDKRWERVSLAYAAMVRGVGNYASDAGKAVKESYEKEITDEFILPTVICSEPLKPLATIADGDVVVCFNFRTDRCREITEALTQKDFTDNNMRKLDLHYLTMTRYDESFKNVEVMYEDDNMDRTLGQVISEAGKKQLRMAETEKYPHVTFFFSGGQERVFPGEKRIMCPSPKVATYDLQPEMSARDLRDNLVKELESGEADFICLNFANPDMVGHTGVFKAVVKACETVDECAKDVITTALKNGYTSLVIADHGNAEMMMNPDGSPHTAHTINPVPCILVDNELTHVKLRDGKLADIAPTILALMGIQKPAEMGGVSLVEVNETVEAGK